MPNPLKNNVLAPTAPIHRERVCPRCQGEIYPLKLGWTARIRGHGSMMYRYECDSYRCSDREYENTEQPQMAVFAFDTGQDSQGRSCPRCQSETFRVKRRLIDLIINRLSPVHRYRCDSRKCDWTGLVRQNPRANSTQN